jgi:hypothetical protein
MAKSAVCHYLLRVFTTRLLKPRDLGSRRERERERETKLQSISIQIVYCSAAFLNASAFDNSIIAMILTV